MSNDNATVTYSFKENALEVQVVVSTRQQQFGAADGNQYPGYAVQSGTGQYTSGGSPYTFTVAPQSVNPFNVLWATSADGCAGSSHGIDTQGLGILGDNGQLSWSPGLTPPSFNIQEGRLAQPVTLVSAQGWPLAQ